MNELLFNTFINLSMIVGIIFMLSIIVGIVRITYEWVKEWVEDWREENEKNNI